MRQKYIHVKKSFCKEQRFFSLGKIWILRQCLSFVLHERRWCSGYSVPGSVIIASHILSPDEASYPKLAIFCVWMWWCEDIVRLWCWFMARRVENNVLALFQYTVGNRFYILLKNACHQQDPDLLAQFSLQLYNLDISKLTERLWLWRQHNS